MNAKSGFFFLFFLLSLPRMLITFDLHRSLITYGQTDRHAGRQMFFILVRAEVGMGRGGSGLCD